MVERRATDLIFEGRISKNEANISHVQEGVDEVKDRLGHLENDVIELKEEMTRGFTQLKDQHDAIIRRLDANSNQLLGAGKLAKFLWLLFPALSGVIGWLWGKFA